MPLKRPLTPGTHAYHPDPRNADILIGIRDGVSGAFSTVWRPMARVSVFDSGFMLGDGVWEGIRVHRGVLVYLEEHLERLYEGAKAIDMDIGASHVCGQCIHCVQGVVRLSVNIGQRWSTLPWVSLTITVCGVDRADTRATHASDV